MNTSIPHKKRKVDSLDDDVVEPNASKHSSADQSSPADSSSPSDWSSPADWSSPSINGGQTFRKPNQQFRTLIVHTVSCSGLGAHADHHEEISYFDCPRLFTGDHKASALRGRRRIDDVNEYIEQHEELHMVIYRVYSCEEYHMSVQDLFENLQLPHQNVTIGSRIRPYLFCLKNDTKDAKWESEDMHVLSGALIRVLEDSLRCSARMSAPYLPLYHQRKSVSEYLSAATGEEHLALAGLMEYIHTHFDADYAEADVMFSQGLVSKKHFTKMFGPDEVVVAADADQPQAYVSNVGVEPTQRSIHLNCWCLTFDGTFRRKATLISLVWPEEKTDILQIHDLDVYPLRFDNTGMEDRLRSRGRIFWNFRVRKYVSYISGNFSFEEQTANPRYMIDMHSYHEMHPKETVSAQDVGEALPEITDGHEMPDDPFPLLFPSTVLGYGFHDKKWRDLVVENIEDVSWNTTAFDRLVLSPRKKRIIKALVTVHVTTSASTDIIEGKGNGLIMLMHGSPGTGKTLTAESIAELTQKPLYRVTCGDIGTEPEAVEKYLESVLFIGTIWGCVVLLDEADVFLEERTQSDLQRNALVSVFLRVLEYYEGILILTSNRVGTFDEAFKSRIQLAVHYPRLKQQDRTIIWRDFINDLDEESTEVERLRENIPRLAQNELNGRQIRNLVKSAKQLAHYDKRKLNFEHFEDMLDVSNEFEEYLEKLHGHKETDWAKDIGIRAD